jgi:hypothetical protein
VCRGCVRRPRPGHNALRWPCRWSAARHAHACAASGRSLRRRAAQRHRSRDRTNKISKQPPYKTHRQVSIVPLCAGRTGRQTYVHRERRCSPTPQPAAGAPPAGALALNDVTRERGRTATSRHPLTQETCPDLGASRRRQISSRRSSRSLTYRDGNRILDCCKMSDGQRDRVGPLFLLAASSRGQLLTLQADTS